MDYFSTLYLGIPITFSRFAGALLCSIECLDTFRFDFIEDPIIKSHFPYFDDDDLFQCICSVKRKYNIS